MTDNYLPSSCGCGTCTCNVKAFEATAKSGIPAVAVGSVILEPEKWAAEYHKLAMDYLGEPEQVYFMNASRRFTALAKVLPTLDQEKPDGFVVLGDID